MENEVVTKKTNFFKEIYELLDTVVLSAVFVLVAFTLLFRIFVVSGPSMVPTLHDKDKLVVSNLFYTPKNGDIICFYSDFKQEVLIKRVIATEGQTVDIGNDLCVYVDGVKLAEPYIAGANTMQHTFRFPYTVEQGKIIVMGDNRVDSLDSRYSEIGPVDVDDVLGRLIFRFYPEFGKVN